MLELTTTRPTMQLKVDGELCEVPLSFTAPELVDMSRAEDRNEAMFAFFASYIPGFERMGDDAVNAVLAEWTRLREEQGEPDMGE